MAWEDLTHGGDRDFNDAVVTISTMIVEPPSPPPKNNGSFGMTLQLDPSTDSAPIGDGQTTFATVILDGQTEANVPVTLVETGTTTTSDAAGQFRFSDVNRRPDRMFFTFERPTPRGRWERARTPLRGSLSASHPRDLRGLGPRPPPPHGATNTDSVTSDPTIAGTVTDASPIASFRAGFDSTPRAGSFLDVSSDRSADGSFQFSPSRLDQILGRFPCPTAPIRCTCRRRTIREMRPKSLTSRSSCPRNPPRSRSNRRHRASLPSQNVTVAGKRHRPDVVGGPATRTG